ncbi:MAG: D-alanyl-D-alanine carboxypeptidase, partial [Lachnospiraceae bacterium]|nr:D-alanyl-D-alanine carboxypeptidase [Lachnospiraceae bacterium]
MISACLSCRTLALASKELQLYSASAVLMDGESGRVLYGKDETCPLPNASTTKIMTCILVLEECGMDEMVSVSEYAASMPKVKLGMQRGETYCARDLLYSLMLESHNDSAAALAEHVGGKLLTNQTGMSEREGSILAIKAFAALMNDKARRIGCEDTYFITPNGLDAEETITQEDGSTRVLEHHVTAKDLARILAYCIQSSPKRQEFLEITQKRSHSFTGNGRSFVLNNHNSFLDMMDGALTGKTGFTGKAGYCYVGALRRDGKLLIVALLACGWPNNKGLKWKDAR